MGETRPSVQIRAVRAHGMQDELVLAGMELFDAVSRGDRLSAEQIEQALPSREFMLEVYKFIKSQGGWKYDIETLCFRLGGHGEQYAKAAVAVEVMLELGTLLRDETGRLVFPEQMKRADLNASALLARIRSGGEFA